DKNSNFHLENEGGVDCSGYPRAGNGKITTCPTNVSPVCGSNDQTYNNECLLLNTGRGSGKGEHIEICSIQEDYEQCHKGSRVSNRMLGWT
uniref:Kazal-like domain-containing protein n=1 Tax=Ornithorhynchus anatinus TaxID=9258 RepID=A0A6I8N3N4_ORNAN